MYLVRFDKAEGTETGHHEVTLTFPQDGMCVRADAVQIVGCVPDSADVVHVDVFWGTERIARARLRHDSHGFGPRARVVAGYRPFQATTDCRRLQTDQILLRAVTTSGREFTIACFRARCFWRRARHPAECDIVSVVIPCFNQSEFLSDAIESALGQRSTGLEIVVVDDGSTDDTARVARRYPVNYVRQDHRGPAAARNTGIRSSQGEFIIFLDADDRLVQGSVERFHAALRDRDEWAFVSGEHRYIDRRGNVLKEWSGVRDRDDPYLALLRKNYIGCPAAVMFRRGALQEVRGFDEAQSACADYDLYLRIARHFPAGVIDDLSAEYRRHPAAMSNDAALMLRESLRVLRSQLPFVRRDRARLAAFREGIAFWRRYYGRPLLSEMLKELRTPGRRSQALPRVWTLATLAPNILFDDLRIASGRGTREIG